MLRLYRPAPTLAFGRLDVLRPGFAAAAAAAREHGFEPVVRAPGGHAVAYHDGCLVIDELLPSADPIAGMQERFAQSGEVLAEALRGLGVDARVGRVPGEFCPGDFTVNARGAVKLVGTAQRVVRRASLLAASVAVATRTRCGTCSPTCTARSTWTGTRRPRAASPTRSRACVDDVERAVLEAYASRWELVETSLDAATLERAEAPGATRGGGGAPAERVVRAAAAPWRSAAAMRSGVGRLRAVSVNCAE